MPARKRERIVPVTPESSGRRRSARVSTGKKSSYFEEDSEDDGAADSYRKHLKRARRASGRGAAKDDDDEDAYKEEEEEEDDDDDGEEDNDGGDYQNQNGQDDDDSEIDENARPKVTFIPHKKLREDGGVEYAETTVHPNSMLFLRDLKKNNKRPWLKANDAEYRRALQDWQSYVETLTTRIAEDADETIPELPAKDVIFRIYRDTRFSKDATPYKPHFSAAWSRTGRKGPYACYYVHCEPGSCYVGGGLWHPENDALRLLRASIDERPHRWQRVLVDDDRFRQTFLSGVKGVKRGDAKSIKKAFAAQNQEGALKTRPQGFLADHRDIELLKLKNFTIGTKVPDTMLTDPHGQDKVLEIVQAMVAFNTHLNRTVKPDPGDEDSDEEDDREDEEV